MRSAFHCMTSPIQSVNRLAVSKWSPGVAGLYDAYSFMSSEYLCFMPCLLNIRCIGVVYIVNITGPRTEACVTPFCSGIVADVFESILTQCVRSPKYIRNHDNTISSTTYSSCNSVSKCSWSILSNALDKSSMTTALYASCRVHYQCHVDVNGCSCRQVNSCR